MPTRRSMPLLREKLRVLEKSGGIDLDALAGDLGRSKNTLFGWGDGAKLCDPNTVPASAYAAFIDAIAKRLPDLARDEIERAMVSQTARSLEALFGVKPPADLLELLEAKAERGMIRLHRQKLGLIETQSASEQEEPDYKLRLGEYFRLEVPRDLRRRHLIALQFGGGLWGSVPVGIDEQTGFAHLPGLLADGAPDYMREVTSAGLHRFFVVTSRRSLPERLNDGRNLGIVDNDLQTRVAVFAIEDAVSVLSVYVKIG